MAAGSPTALVAGSVTAQRPRPHQLFCGAAGIGNLEDGGIAAQDVAVGSMLPIGPMQRVR